MQRSESANHCPIQLGMALLKQLRGFFRAFKNNDGPPAVKHAGHSLAATIEDATHVRGSSGSGAKAAFGRGQDRINELAAEGHKNYQKSLEADD